MKNDDYCHQSKAVIIGAGMVGATTAFALMTLSEISEIVIIDVDPEKASGEAMDLNHGLAFTDNKKIYAGNYADTKGADFIIITAGVKQQPGEPRTELASKNYEILSSILKESTKYNDTALYLIVSNPVDVLTYATFKLTGMPRTRIIGSGTNLDSSRFRYLIADKLKCSPKEVNAYILGEHGDSEFPVKSQVDIAGLKLSTIEDLPKIDMDDLFNQTRNAAYEVIKRKGATYYAIALSIADIVGEILSDQRAVNPLSVCLEGEYGLKDVALSVPIITGKEGVKQILEVELTKEEMQKLHESADKLKAVYKEITA
jgi:L-lactate dehydrogenase